ncbi:AbrB/MazE/SpoVT family DNA-binding domain-containing protein [Crenothrix sp.]|uniref:AbrB/MazE/SpoVT family DNA-binding domain-containing protein n=1 Tax=Crenothrix sp. TaxID=3100433 RepID=UPI00374D3DC2
MHTTNLRKVGGSTMLVIPPAYLDQLHIKAGNAVDIEVEQGRLIVKPQFRQRYTLSDLLAQCDASEDITAEDRAWLDSAPVGNELI